MLRSGIPLAHLKIGECIVSTRPLLVSTVLGSCVSVCFHHPASLTGAIFHAMLPTVSMARDAKPCCKFVDSAMDLVVTRLGRLGIPLAGVECKLFGGGFTIQPERKEHVRNVVDVGRKNVEVARAALAGLGLKILSEDVLGRYGRKLFFATHTGEVWMRNVSCSAPASGE
ncbi:MAG: chemotaxis protein CheD [Thermodesulfobacteriota bacterium]